MKQERIHTKSHKCINEQHDAFRSNQFDFLLPRLQKQNKQTCEAHELDDSVTAGMCQPQSLSCAKLSEKNAQINHTIQQRIVMTNAIT